MGRRRRQRAPPILCTGASPCGVSLIVRLKDTGAKGFFRFERRKRNLPLRVVLHVEAIDLEDVPLVPRPLRVAERHLQRKNRKTGLDTNEE